MAIDFSKPATTDPYATGFVPNIQANQVALAQWLDSAQTAITGTPPTYAKRYNATSSAVEQWNGSAWVPIPFHGIQTAGGNVGVGGPPSAKLNVVGGLTISTLADWNARANTQFNLANFGVRFGIGYSAADIIELQGYDSANAARAISMQRLGGAVGIGPITPAYLLDVLSPISGAKLFRFAAIGGASLLGYSDAGGAGITNSDPQSSGSMLYLSSTTAQIYTAGAQRVNVDAAGAMNIGSLAVIGAYVLGVNGPIVQDARPGVNGIIFSGNTNDVFTVDTNKVIGSYNITYKTFSDAPTGPSAVISGFGGARIYTSNVERLRVDSAGNTLPGATASYNLGGPSSVWNIIYGGQVQAPAAGGLLLNASNAAGQITMRTNGADRAALTNAGLLQMAAGNAAGGVQLPNAANASPMVMDWYEEGNFVPTVVGQTSAGAAGAYTVQVGRFVRFGRMVFVHIEIAWTTHSGTGFAQINGLPYAAAFSQKPLRAVPIVTGLTSDAWRGQTTAGSTFLLLFGNNQNTGANANRSIAANDIWEIDGWYEV